MTFASSFARPAKWGARRARIEAGPPVVVGHSFGGRIAVGLAHDFGDELAAAVMVDPPFFAPKNERNPAPPRATPREHSVRPSLEAIIARFRLAPPQACDNLFILDFIARRSARKAVDAEGNAGWSLSFDPHFWEKFGRLDPVALVKARALAARDHSRREVATLPSRGRSLSSEPHRARLALRRDPGSRASCDDRPAAGFRSGAPRAARGVACGEDGSRVHSSRTVTASDAPLASVTDTRAKPAPSGFQADWRRISASPTGAPLTNQVKGGAPPSAFKASG